MTQDFDVDSLSPGIRDLVVALRARGWPTCDSGDGSNYAAGMECARPERHVTVNCGVFEDSVTSPIALAKNLHADAVATGLVGEACVVHLMWATDDRLLILDLLPDGLWLEAGK